MSCGNVVACHAGKFRRLLSVTKRKKKNKRRNRIKTYPRSINTHKLAKTIQLLEFTQTLDTNIGNKYCAKPLISQIRSRQVKNTLNISAQKLSRPRYMIPLETGGGRRSCKINTQYSTPYLQKKRCAISHLHPVSSYAVQQRATRTNER